MNIQMRNCPACGNIVKGRADKKFCNDYCRNNYNNQLNSDTVNYVRNVNNILRRNRRILEEILQGEEKKVITKSKAELIKKGFHFDFFTSIYITREEQAYYYCYEYGYTLTEKENCLIVRNILKNLLEPMSKG
jgi:hypothetical protein